MAAMTMMATCCNLKRLAGSSGTGMDAFYQAATSHQRAEDTPENGRCVRGREKNGRQTPKTRRMCLKNEAPPKLDRGCSRHRREIWWVRVPELTLDDNVET